FRDEFARTVGGGVQARERRIDIGIDGAALTGIFRRSRSGSRGVVVQPASPIPLPASTALVVKMNCLLSMIILLRYI
ncbi:MAG: hypothetical protein JWQ21_3055, partial [Herminiimonas sp.]|nr:hypothetical protein [Herminiimonas sp.]